MYAHFEGGTLTSPKVKCTREWALLVTAVILRTEVVVERFRNFAWLRSGPTCTSFSQRFDQCMPEVGRLVPVSLPYARSRSLTFSVRTEEGTIHIYLRPLQVCNCCFCDQPPRLTFRHRASSI